ncbi:hypothetical protein IDM40_13490 [Nocardiopsis sp. HNM0947]|uniref:Uncharacterized protein n=1 Tax=Nocardiopsis coralli TaxID=2772213 RepID=A0ABR9P787_9ACTN|nr:hypothetical protein [Nocardiopsis coralli]MBE2999715.1 hypothetical protein [Nocardiopsis coralli]
MTPLQQHRPCPGADGPPSVPPVSGVVVGVDLRGIQAFVFGGRRILDAVGRAALVAELTDSGDAEHGIADLVPDDCLVLRDAGGAFTGVFADRGAARLFTARYTRHLRDRAGGLTPIVAHVPYGPGETVDEALALLPQRLREARGHMSTLHVPAHGYGITAECAVSGAPAEVVDASRSAGAGGGGDKVPERVSADVARARGVGRRWHRQQERAWLDPEPHAPRSGPRLALPKETDRLGREHGELSRIAVAHIDVNGLGVLLGEYRERVADPQVPGSGALAQRELSRRIAGLTEGLARALVRAVAATVRTEPGSHAVVPGVGPGGAVTLAPGADRSTDHPDRDLHGTVSLPLRPIVVAGDDLTLVCDARLALPLVRYALDWLDADPERIADPADPRVALHRALDHDGRGPRRSVHGANTTCVPTVGVGLAIQPVGAPLSLGYDVCEALCSRAKARRVARPEGESDDHVVAWATRSDGVERALERLDRRGTLPLTGHELRVFLDSHLGAHAPGSLLPGGAPRERGWLHSTLVPLLESGADPEPELLRRERATGRAVDLPRGWTPGGLLDAVEVMDLHLDPGLAAALDPHRPQPLGRTGAGGPACPTPTSGGPAP